jgi:hypothetical protein
MMGQVVFPYFQPAAVSVRGKRLQGWAPRMAPSAVRVPNPTHAPLPIQFFARAPQVFVHEGARQALERRLENAHLGPVALHINDNVSRMVVSGKRGDQLRVCVHHMFLDAPPAVQEALVRYVVANDRGASNELGRFIAAHHFRIRASRPPTRPLRTRGQVHDLLPLFQRNNQRYFGGTHDALITWARRSPKPARQSPRRSIKLGSYDAVQRLVRVHPVLDQAWVPRYFVEYVVFHEMLHHVVPIYREGGRAVLHPAQFRERERQFHAYERAITWEREHIARLLRS